MGGVVALSVIEPEGWLDQVLEDFERAMLRRQLAANTVRIYRWAIQDLFELLESVGISDIRELHRQHLERWQDRMVDNHWKPRTRSLAGSAARQLIDWASERGLVDLQLKRAVAKVKAPQLLPKPIPPEDFARIKLLLLPRRRKAHIVELRDRALFFYLLTTTARVSEALQVQRDEVQDALVRQKGGSEKRLMAPPAAMEMVFDYIKARSDDSPWLWISHRSNMPLHRLSPPGVREIWRKIARKAGVKPWTTHQLRHTGATELLEAGVPELVVAEHLGHHGLGTLHIYGQVRNKQRQQAVDAMQNLMEPPSLLRKLPPGGIRR
jgi:integrase/recombinase XerD